MENTTENEQNKSESISKKEQALISQLVEMRKEHQQDLPYETLDGYEVPPRTQFSMLKKPALTFKLSKMEFNASAVRIFPALRKFCPS